MGRRVRPVGTGAARGRLLPGGLPLPVVPARRPGPDDGPPSGHRECLAAHIPPTDVERELWSALDQRV
ncbi:DUF6059 family protein [Streptomyces sp. 3213.3]|uniref:DUF6059 family protein n=1 Tax=Streptomyces sp. 3213.3 TaxID=1855348 RepID=UPI003FA6D38D